jgi:hypothetical protein
MKEYRSIQDLFASVMIMNVDMLRATVIDVVICEHNEGLIVSEYGDRNEVVLKISSKLDHPYSSS